MQKSLLLLSLITLSALSLEARSLSPAEALARVNGTRSSGVSRSTTVDATPVMAVGSATAPAIYVFNQPGSGYMVVSADDVAAPLLGYSDNGTFDPQDIPDNLRWWLDEYKAQIEAAVESGSRPYEVVGRTPKAAIAPMLKTAWNQGAPYNNLCPSLNGQRTVTGCVATAMAQVMNYHKYPAKASSTANFSYKWEAGNRTLTADYRNFAFDWANMLDSYSSAYTSAQATAVANLMKACGYSVEMGYNVSSAGGSGTASDLVSGALADYFGYSADLHNEPRVLYTASGWEDLIYNDLKASGPVLYAGNGSGGGHCFVCDGYSSNGYFHFDWGWSGMANGYFLLNALDPDQLGIGGGTGGFNLGQMALIGAKPASGSVTPAPLKFVCDGMLSASVSGSDVVVSGNFANYSNRTVSGTIIMQIQKEDGSVATSAKWGSSGYSPGSYYPELTIQSTYWRFLADGTYRICPKYQTSDGILYSYLCSPSQAGYVEVVKASGKLTVKVPGADDYSIAGQELKSGFYLNTDFYVSGRTHYTGSTEAQQSIYGVLMSGTSASSVIGVGDEMSVSFVPGSDVAFDYFSSWFLTPDLKNILSVTPGEYYFAFAMQFGGSESYKLLSTPVKVAVGAELGDMSVDIVNWSIQNPTAVDPSNINVSITARCSSAAFQGSLAVVFFNESGTNYIGEFYTDYVSMTLGQTKTFNAKGAIPGTKGQKMLVALFDDEQLSNAIQITIGEVSGIDDVIADGGKALTASPNPAVDYTVIAASSEISRVDLMSVGGLVTGAQVDIDGTTARVDVSSLSAGLYIARVVTATGVETVKIIKK